MIQIKLAISIIVCMSSNLNRVLKNTGWMIVGRVFQMVLSFIITMMTARYLGPSNYGIINYISSFSAIFAPICTLGLNDIIIKELVLDQEKDGETVGTMICMRLLSSSMAFISIVGLVACLNKNNKLYCTISMLQSFAIILNSMETISYWYQYKLESKKVTFVSSIAFVIMSLYRVWILVEQKDVRWFAAASSIVALVEAVLLFLCYRHDRQHNLSFSIIRARQLLSRSYHYILSGLMVALYGQMDKLMLEHYLNEAEVGYYSAALQLCNYWPFILLAIISSSRTVIIRDYEKDRCKYIEHLRYLYAAVIWIGILVGVVLSVFARRVITASFGPSFEPSINVLRVICWYTIFSYLGMARMVFMLCEGLQSYEKYLSFCGAILNMILNFLFIKHFGSLGAAMATLLTQVLVNFLIPLLLPRLRPSSLLMIDAFLLRGMNFRHLKELLFNRKKRNE